MIKKPPRKQFTFDEDEILKKAVSNIGENDWEKVSSLIPNRTPRQCRDRWNKYLSPNLRGSMWTKEEDQLLLSLFNCFGNKWTKIATYFKGRSDINIKNRYKNLISPSNQNFAPINSINTQNQLNIDNSNRFFDEEKMKNNLQNSPSKPMLKNIVLDPNIVREASIYNEKANKEICVILNSMEPQFTFHSLIKM